jgi:PPM family protein phosphatase
MGRAHPRGVDELLSIGEFSSQCGLSIKMLRSYASAGLIPPAAIDPSSGYRYYSKRQLAQARLIGQLRRADVSIEEIREFLRQPDPARIDSWENEIRHTSASRHQALADARAALFDDHEQSQRWPSSQQEENDMSHPLSAATATHTGKRSINEDSALIGDRCWAVADGFSGGEGREVASRIALDALLSNLDGSATIRQLLDAFQAANRAVWEHNPQSSSDALCGTTLTALALTSDAGAVAVNVGDSRLLRYRDGRMMQLTRDHTVTAEMVLAGELNDHDARSHPYRHVLSRALGIGPDVEIDYGGLSLKRGDRFLLCSDGLTNTLPSDTIKAALTAGEPQAVADNLVDEAVQRGADDNVTAVVIVAE